jgi:hypothetical protein
VARCFNGLLDSEPSIRRYASELLIRGEIQLCELGVGACADPAVELLGIARIWNASATESARVVRPAPR